MPQDQKASSVQGSSPDSSRTVSTPEGIPFEPLRNLERLLGENIHDTALVERYVELAHPDAEDRARRVLEALASTHVASAEFHLGLGLLALRSGNTEALEHAVLQGLRRNANHAPLKALAERVGSDVREEIRERWQKIESLVDEACASLADSPGQLLVRLESLITQCPSCHKAQRAFFSLCQRTRDCTSAQRLYDWLEPLEGRLPSLTFQVAQVFAAAQRPSEALDLALKSLVEVPTKGASDFTIRLVMKHPHLRSRLRGRVEELLREAPCPGLLEYVLTVLEGAVALDEGKGGNLGEHLLSVARDLELRGKGEDAARAYQQWAEMNPSVANYLEAAIATERLGSLGRAVFLYNEVVHLDPNHVQAALGRDRVLRAKGQSIPRPQPATEPSTLPVTRKDFQNGDPKKVFEQLRRWANRQGTLAAWVQAARLCEECQQPMFAVQLFDHVLEVDANHLEARSSLDRLLSGEGVTTGLDLKSIKDYFDLGAPDAALRTAREFASSTALPETLAELTALIRQRCPGQSLEAWLPATGAARTILLWLHEEARDEDLASAGVELATMRRWAGLLAMHEQRWQEARRWLDPLGGVESIIARFSSGDAAGAVALLPLAADLIGAAFDQVQLPEPRSPERLQLPPDLRDSVQRAWEKYHLGGKADLEEAASRYQLAGKEPGPLSLELRLNEALLRLKIPDQARRAEAVLLDLRKQYPRDPRIPWVHAVCAIRLEQYNDALAALRTLLATEPGHRKARQLAAATCLRTQVPAEAHALLSASPGLIWERNAQMMLLVSGHLSGDRQFEEAVRQVVQAYQFRLAREGGNTAKPQAAKPQAAKPQPTPPPRSKATQQPTKLSPAEIQRALDAARSQGKNAEVREQMLTFFQPRPPADPSKNRNPPGRQASPVAPPVGNPDKPALPPGAMTERELRQHIAELRRSGQADEVIPFLQGYLRKSPGFVPARLLLARELEQAGQVDQAERKLLEGLAGTTRGDRNHRRLLVEVVTFQLQHGSAAGAVESLKQLSVKDLAQAPEFRPLLEQVAENDATQCGRVLLAEVLWESGDPTRAKTILQDALSERPADSAIQAACEKRAPRLLRRIECKPEWVRGQWVRRLKRGEIASGLELIRQYRQYSGNGPEFIRIEARALHEIGRSEEALQLLGPLVEEQGQQQDRLLLQDLQAHLHRGGGEDSASLPGIDPAPTATREEASNAILDLPQLQQRVARFRREDKLPLALQLVQSQRASRPDDTNLKRVEIEVLRYGGSHEEACSLLEPLARQTNLRADWLLLARELACLQRTADEEAVYARLLERNPFDKEVHSLLRQSKRDHLLPCPVEDPDLLKACSRLIESRRVEDQHLVKTRVLALRNRQLAIPVLEYLLRLFPDSRQWQDLLDQTRAAAAKPPAPALPPRLSATVDAAVDQGEPLAPHEDGIPGRVLEGTTRPAGLPAMELPEGPESSTSSTGEGVWETFLNSNNEGRTWLVVVETTCPTARQFLSSVRTGETAALDPRRAVASLLQQTLEVGLGQRCEDRCPVLLEVSWLYRILARLFRHSRSGGDRGGARRPQEVWFHLPPEHRDRYERTFLPEALRALSVLPYRESLSQAQKLSEHAPQILPYWMKQLTRALQDLRKLAGHLEDLECVGEMDRRRWLINRCYPLCDHLSRGKWDHIPAIVRTQLATLVDRWERNLTVHSSLMRRAPRLHVVVKSTEPGENSGSFLTNLELYNSGDATAQAVQVYRDDRRQGEELTIEPRERTTVSIRIDNVLESSRAVELQGEVRFHATETGDDVQRFAMVVIPPWASPYRPIPANVYEAGTPIEPGHPTFVNRRGLLEQIREALGGPNHRNVVLLHGLRRVGKTSLLKTLLKLPGGDLPGFLCLQATSISDADTGYVLFKLACTISDALRLANPPLEIDPRERSLEQWRKEPTFCFDSFLEQVRRVIGSHRILLMLDEFEALLDKIASGRVDQGILAFLRSTMQHQPYLVFILVGADRVYEMVRAYNTSLFNLVRPFEIAFFSDEEAEFLIRKPLEDHVTYEDAAVAALKKETRGHPYFLQHLCAALVSQLRQDKSRNHITELDVLVAIETTVKDARLDDAYVQLLLNLEHLDQVVFVVLAEATEYSTYASVDDLRKRLRDIDHPISEAELYESMDRLARINLVENRNRPDHTFEYCIRIPFYARWLRKHRSAAALVAQFFPSEEGHAEDWNDSAFLGGEDPR